MTLSGAAADHRYLATPTEQKQIVAAIYNALFGGATVKLSDKLSAGVKKAVAEIKKAGARAVFVTGVQDKDAQLIALAINEKLQSKAFDASAPKLTSQGDAKQVATLVALSLIHI